MDEGEDEDEDVDLDGDEDGDVDEGVDEDGDEDVDEDVDVNISREMRAPCNNTIDRRLTMPTPSRTRAMKLKCKDCMHQFADGRRDCEVQTCSLYHWMPYRGLEPDYACLAKKVRTAAQLANDEERGRRLAAARIAARSVSNTES